MRDKVIRTQTNFKILFDFEFFYLIKMCFSVRNGVFRGSYDDLSMFLGEKKELKFKFFRLKHLYLDFSIIKATFSD